MYIITHVGNIDRYFCALLKKSIAGEDLEVKPGNIIQRNWYLLIDISEKVIKVVGLA